MSDIKKNPHATNLQVETENTGERLNMEGADAAENKDERERASKVLKLIFAISVIILIIVILLRGCSNTYYTPTGTYQKIEPDKNQEAIEEPESEEVAPEINVVDDHEPKNCVTLYSLGNVATASNSTKKVSVNVYNIEEANVNMVLEIYIPDSELLSKIGTNGRTKSSQTEIDAKVKAAKSANGSYSPAVCIAKSGLIFPGNKITTLNLNTLEDGTVLPAGTYSAYYKETFYDDDGNLSSVDASLEITLVVK